ncbi:hypothetical protein [Ruminococcus albus]|uniref:PH domain-containing protein n=1 Tax=Ruminococcus albus TaxID=1264 RepID=A0A1I1L7Y4_RUMAL|nr:hypothetical protein [Ruminococcus albus]SFC69207.1 hypothetical protein SAMN02910406_02184 [Ruminococcus albus]
MKKRFTFKSAYYMTVAVAGAAAIVILPVIAAFSLNSTFAGLITLGLALILHIISLHLAARVPCVISADEDALRVDVWCKKYVFLYQDIEKAEVSHEFVETLMLREVPYYLETLKITAKSGEYSFKSKTRAFIQEDGRPYPFENGKFQEIRRYIAPRIIGGGQ